MAVCPYYAGGSSRGAGVCKGHLRPRTFGVPQQKEHLAQGGLLREELWDQVSQMWLKILSFHGCPRNELWFSLIGGEHNHLPSTLAAPKDIKSNV